MNPQKLKLGTDRRTIIARMEPPPGMTQLAWDEAMTEHQRSRDKELSRSDRLCGGLVTPYLVTRSQEPLSLHTSPGLLDALGGGANSGDRNCHLPASRTRREAITNTQKHPVRFSTLTAEQRARLEEGLLRLATAAGNRIKSDEPMLQMPDDAPEQLPPTVAKLRPKP